MVVNPNCFGYSLRVRACCCILGSVKLDFIRIMWGIALSTVSTSNNSISVALVPEHEMYVHNLAIRHLFVLID